MRLRTIHKVLEVTLGDVRIVQMQAQPNMQIDGLQGLLRVTREIEKTGVLRREVQAILGFVEVSGSGQNSLLVSGDVANKLQAAVGDLARNGAVLRAVLADFLGNEPEESVAIRLPEVSNLSDLSKNLEQLEKILEQVLVSPHVKGEVRFSDFDRGSPWLEIIIGTATAVNFLGKLVRFIYECREKELALKAKAEIIRDIEVQVDAKKAFEEALEKEIEQFSEAGLQDLLSEVGADSDNEFRQRVKYSIKELGDLIGRGLEIHPMLSAPLATQKLFPDSERIFKEIRALPATLADDDDISDEEVVDDDEEVVDDED